MQNIEIKSGTSAKITISPKINGEVATSAQMSGVKIYVFLVYQFTNKIYGTPYELSGSKLTINLTPSETIAMLGNASENQKFELQFAIKNANGEIIAEEKDSNVVINIIRWEAGQWLHQQSQN
ncbi:MAG: hypothetical protein IKW20_00030 [Bacteroidales bacterium]|nr:hypothetical protein [Bacteroidales bacterium]